MISHINEPVPAPQFANLLRLAAHLCDVPMALVTSCESGTISVECQHGISGVPDIGFCAQALLQDDLFEVMDASQDARFHDLPQVCGTPFIRFYFGAPLISPTGYRFGTLGLLDVRPRTINSAQREHLRTLAHQVMVHMELRRQRKALEDLAKELDQANRRLAEQAEHLNQAQHIAHVGSWKYLIDEDHLVLSDEILRMYGLAPGEFAETMDAFIDLVHPEDKETVETAKETVMRYGHASVQCRIVRTDGEVRYFEIIGQMFTHHGGPPYMAGTTQDITDKKAAEDKIRQLAYYDQLTGLPNRRFVLDRIDRLTAMRRRLAHDGAVLFIDLDNFKTLNDTHGHDKGDLLLRQVAQRLLSCVRQYDCVGRFGGDEFVVLLELIGDDALDGVTHALQVAKKVLNVLNTPFQLDSLPYTTTPSIGIALIDGEMLSTGELLKRADMAMYQAKAEGRNAIRFFNPDMQDTVNTRAALEVDLRQALAEHAFYLEYQPQVDETGKINGVEALLRWRHPKRGHVPPSEFIPFAEEIGMIMEIGGWLVREACRQLVQWSRVATTQDLVLSINISARQFHHPTFISQITETLANTGADPAKLKIEITESVLVRNFDDIRKKMTVLKALGIRFALDDFGTGYSSLAYLQQLPLDQLKIDQSFVHHVMTNKNDAAITRSIISLAHNLGLSVIAEGVETEEQRQFLAREGCDHYQGFLYHAPLTARMVEDRIDDGRPL